MDSGKDVTLRMMLLLPFLLKAHFVNLLLCNILLNLHAFLVCVLILTP